MRWCFFPLGNCLDSSNKLTHLLEPCIICQEMADLFFYHILAFWSNHVPGGYLYHKNYMISGECTFCMFCIRGPCETLVFAFLDFLVCRITRTLDMSKHMRLLWRIRILLRVHGLRIILIMEQTCLFQYPRLCVVFSLSEKKQLYTAVPLHLKQSPFDL